MPAKLMAAAPLLLRGRLADETSPRRDRSSDRRPSRPAPASSVRCGRCRSCRVPSATLSVGHGAARVGSRWRLADELERPAEPAADGRSCAGSRRAVDQTTDPDAVTFVCKPPTKEKRRGGISFAGIEHGSSTRAAPSRAVTGRRTRRPARPHGRRRCTRASSEGASTSAGSSREEALVGRAETTFLMDKSEVNSVPARGRADPGASGGLSLSGDHVEDARLAGAPKDRVHSPGTLGARSDHSRAFRHPIRPAGGFQAHMAPFMLGDVRRPKGVRWCDSASEAFDVGSGSSSLHEGSHHSSSAPSPATHNAQGAANATARLRRPVPERLSRHCEPVRLRLVVPRRRADAALSVWI